MMNLFRIVGPICVFLFLFSLNICLADESDDEELVLVQAIWRHGDRSPTQTFKKDIYQEEDWPQGWGQLTPVGMRQHVQLGQKLRSRYIKGLKFVSDHYKNHEIYVRSTDHNRTLISAISNLIGFYGPGNDDEYPQELNTDWPGKYVPIPVHTIPGNEDFIAPGEPDCPRLSELWNVMKRAPEYQSTMEQYKSMNEFLAEKTGENMDEAIRWWIIWDALFIEKLKNRPLVDWAEGNTTLMESMQTLNNIQFNWANGFGLSSVDDVDFSVEMPRIRGGPILWKMIGNMQDKLRCQQRMNAVREQDREIEGKKSPLGVPLCQWINKMRYFVYSAHDSTLAALFAALGFPKTNYIQDGIPPYSTSLTVELWRNKKNGQHSVKVLYWPPVMPEAAGFIYATADVSGCADGCTLEQFVKRSEPYHMLPSPEEYCQKPLITTTTTTTTTTPAPSGNSSARSMFGWMQTMTILLAILLFTTRAA